MNILRGLFNGLTGLLTQQVRLDTVANNFANINTAGFKKQTSSFSTLLYGEMGPAGRPVESAPVATAFLPGSAGSVATFLQGTGVRTAALTRDFSFAEEVETGRPLDLTIEGEGFFRVELPEGGVAFTRNGNFTIDPQGRLTTSNGYLLSPSLTLPENYLSVTFQPNGLVVATGKDGTFVEAGQLYLYRFVNPAGLLAQGRNIYVATSASGDPIEGKPGENGLGRIKQGCLEGSNVDLLEGMSELIEAQRSYQVSLRTIRAVDEIWEMANNLKKE